jgi:hypothetical protein
MSNQRKLLLFAAALVGLFALAVLLPLLPVERLFRGTVTEANAKYHHLSVAAHTPGLKATKEARLPKEPKAEKILVQKGKETPISGVLPETVVPKPGPPAPPPPPVGVSAPSFAKKVSLPPGDTPPPNREPPVPRGLMVQGPLAEEGPNSPEHVVTRWKAKRYFFRNLSDTVFAIGERTDDKGDFGGINPQTFAPRGEMIEAALVNCAFSSNTEIDVVAAVWLPFYFQGHLLLEPGCRILGTASRGKLRDRMRVRFDHIILKDGRSFPIDGVALHTDGTEGIKGYLISEWAKRLLAPLTAGLGQGFLEALQYQSYTYTMTPLGPYGVPKDQSMKGAFYQAGTYGGVSALQKLQEILVEDMDEYRPYVFVPAGTRFRVYLKRYVDVSQADYGK